MCRTAAVEEKGRRKRGKRSRQAGRPGQEEEEGGPGPRREYTEVGLVCRDDARVSVNLRVLKLSV